MAESFTSYRIWQPLLLGLACCIGFWAGLKVQLPKIKSDPFTQNINAGYTQSQKINDVLTYIQSKYVDSLNLGNLSNAGIARLMAALDPYSEYIPSENMDGHMDELHGISSDFGFDCIYLNDRWVVCKVEPDGQAFQKGLRSGAMLCEVNGSPFIGKDGLWESSLNEMAVNEKSIKLNFKISEKAVCDSIAFIPDRKQRSAVSLDHLIKDGAVYLKLAQFNKGSYRDFMNVIEKYVVQNNCSNFIIDLRGNYGGLLNEVAYMLNQLIAEKDVLLFKTTGYNVKDKEFKSTGKPFFRINNIAILIDEHTASAAELFAAALQDLDRAKIFGSPSFGKAMVLEQFNLADGSALLMSVSRFTSHSGRSIQKPLDPIYTDGSIDATAYQKYFSSVYKRSLPAHQGVWPDVQIEKDSISKALFLVFDHLLDSLIYSNFDEFKKFMEDEQTELESNVGLNGFIAELLAKQTIVSRDVQLSNYLSTELYFKLYGWFYGSVQERRARLKRDPCLIKAVNWIQEASVETKGKQQKYR